MYKRQIYIIVHTVILLNLSISTLLYIGNFHLIRYRGIKKPEHVCARVFIHLVRKVSVRWCYRWVHSHQHYLSWPDSLYLSSLTWSFLLQFDFECKDTIIKREKRRKPKDFLPFLLKSLLLSIQPAQIKIFVPYQYYIFCNFLRYSEGNKPSATISLSFLPMDSCKNSSFARVHTFVQNGK